MDKKYWFDGLKGEIDFWDKELQNPSKELLERFDPKRPFADTEAVKHLSRNGV